MRITKIESQKRRPNRKSIYVDGKFAVGVDEEVLFSFNLKEGMEITTPLLEKLIHVEEKRKLKERAFNLLSYRARSKKELIDRLKQKETDPQLINEVINELSAVELINDFEFAQSWVSERGKLYGPFRLRNELIKKGIAKEIIDQVLDEFNEVEVANKLAAKWINRHKNLAPKVLERRLFGFLARRGISYDTIKSLNIFK